MKGRLQLLRYFVPVLLILFFLSMTTYSARRAPWYEQMLWNLILPAQQLFTGTSRSLSNFWDRYLSLVGVEKENERLRADVQMLEKRIFEYQEVAEENQRLHALLAHQRQQQYPSVVARVIASDPRAQFQTLTIDKGREDGVDILMPVLGKRGLIGRVAKVSSGSSLVMLLADLNSAIDVLVQRSRSRALLVGTGRRTELKHSFALTRLEYLHRVSDIEEDDVIITSGFDQVFPPGIPIGTVKRIEASELGVFQEALVVPFENFFEVQEVLVLRRGK